MKLLFTARELNAANDAWGCNCGPSALAFAVQQPLDAVRHALPGFQDKGYTNPTMMQAGLAFFRKTFAVVRPPKFTRGKFFSVAEMFDATPSLVRVQWDGPWCDAGANARWGYGFTHWIATWSERGVDLVFDCNSLIVTGAQWCDEVGPQLARTVRRSTGEWFPTHIWRLGGSA